MSYIKVNRRDIKLYKWLAFAWCVVGCLEIMNCDYNLARDHFVITIMAIEAHSKSLRIEALTKLVTKFQCAIRDATTNEKE